MRVRACQLLRRGCLRAALAIQLHLGDRAPNGAASAGGARNSASAAESDAERATRRGARQCVEDERRVLLLSPLLPLLRPLLLCVRQRLHGVAHLREGANLRVSVACGDVAQAAGTLTRESVARARRRQALRGAALPPAGAAAEAHAHATSAQQARGGSASRRGAQLRVRRATHAPRALACTRQHTA